MRSYAISLRVVTRNRRNCKANPTLLNSTTISQQNEFAKCFLWQAGKGGQLGTGQGRRNGWANEFSRRGISRSSRVPSILCFVYTFEKPRPLSLDTSWHIRYYNIVEGNICVPSFTIPLFERVIVSLFQLCITNQMHFPI